MPFITFVKFLHIYVRYKVSMMIVYDTVGESMERCRRCLNLCPSSGLPLEPCNPCDSDHYILDI